MSPDVYLTIKAIFSGVKSCAAIIRSPSFSRDKSSRTTTNSPFSEVRQQEPLGGVEKSVLLKDEIVSSIESNRPVAGAGEGIVSVE